MKTILSLCLLFLAICSQAAPPSQTATNIMLEWSPSPTASVTNYTVHVSVLSGTNLVDPPTATLDVGLNLRAAVNVNTYGRWVFFVTAQGEGMTSEPSNEVSFLHEPTKPQPPWQLTVLTGETPTGPWTPFPGLPVMNVELDKMQGFLRVELVNTNQPQRVQKSVTPAHPIEPEFFIDAINRQVNTNQPKASYRPARKLFDPSQPISPEVFFQLMEMARTNRGLMFEPPP